MKKHKIEKPASTTGATIELVTKSGAVKEQAARTIECRPEYDPYASPDCAPNYHCSPDDEGSANVKPKPVAAAADLLEEDDCQDYGCCPKKPAQDCEPNV